MGDVTSITQIAGNLTLTGLLVLIVAGYVAGKIPTKREVERCDEENARLHKQIEEAREELKANNAVIERLASTVSEVRATMVELLRNTESRTRR